MKNCALCLKKGPHFHILVENGCVMSVWYISTKDFWDRELDIDEYTVSYNTRPQSTESTFQRVLHAVKQKVLAFGRKPADTWLEPKVYKGKSMHEEELEHQP
jgi:hypothetical protein